MDFVKYKRKFYPLSVLALEVVENKITCSCDLQATVIGTNEVIILGDITSRGGDYDVQQLIKSLKLNF